MLVTLKKEIRQKVLAARNSISLEDRIYFSRKICAGLLNLEVFKKAKTVHFYLNTKSEVNTEEAVRKSLLTGKNVVVPVINHKTRHLLLSVLKDYDNDLAAMPHGIHEPKPELLRPVSLNEVDLMVLPGVAFDQFGHRLGYGAGYYDRLLHSDAARPFLIALAFELQIVDEIPVGSHDVKVDMIVTEERIINAGSG